MIENLNLILKVIESDIFLSYFYYTVIFFFASIFIRNKSRHQFDDVCTDFLIHSGIFFIGIIIIKSILLLTITDLPNSAEEIHNMFGEHWLGYWMIPLIHVVLTQLLRLNKIKRNILPRLILVLLLAFTWERYSGFLAYDSVKHWESLGPEYKSSVLDKFTAFYMFKHIALRILIYILLAYAYYVILRVIKNRFTTEPKLH